MLTTAEAADVMKKPIHEEIIILQNYFKSRRAPRRMGWRGAGDRLLSLRVSCHRPATSEGWTTWLWRGGNLQASCTRGWAKRACELLKKSKTWPRRTWPQSQQGTVSVAFAGPALKTGGCSPQIHQLTNRRDGSFQLKPLAKLFPA